MGRERLTKGGDDSHSAKWIRLNVDTLRFAVDAFILWNRTYVQFADKQAASP